MPPPRRRPPLLLELAIAAALALLVRAHVPHDGHGTPVSLAFFQFVVAAVVEVFQWLASSAATIATVVFEVVKIIGARLVNFAGAVAGVFKHTWDFFQVVWSTTIRPFVGWAWTQVQRLHAWLVKTFAPVLKHLHMLRTWILDHYDRWLRPIFAALDAVRGTVQLLEQFHVPFARKIDQALGALEDRLLVPIRLALTKVNEAINWIDRIVTFDGLFQRLTLIASLVRYDQDAWNALLHRQVRGLTPEEKSERAGQHYERNDPSAAGASLGTFYATDGGSLAPVIGELVPTWFAAASRRGVS